MGSSVGGFVKLISMTGPLAMESALVRVQGLPFLCHLQMQVRMMKGGTQQE